jgi:hypothetical protein
MSSLLHLFCQVDDFCQQFLPAVQACAIEPGKRNRKRSLAQSEIMTILIAFHQSGYRNFKTFYLCHVCRHWQSEFPGLVSYHRFVELMPSALVALFAYLRSCLGRCSGLSFIDSTALRVCHNARIHQHKVFAGIAKRGKTSTGWFFGFKLHLVVSDTGDLLNFTLTSANTDDRKPVPDLLSDLFGKVFADKGYVSKPLHDLLFKRGVELITKLRKNMASRPLPDADKLLLRKRAIIETIIDQLKNISQVEHSRHRAPCGFLWNLAAGLIAYCHQPKKPSLHLRDGVALIPA